MFVLIVRRLFIGEVTVDHDRWTHLRTVLRIQTDVFDCETGEEKSSDERYLMSSLPSLRLTPQHWLFVIRRHSDVETSHQILDTASPKTTTLGSKPTRAQRWSSRSCAASPTRYSRSFAASPNAPTSDELCLGNPDV